MSDDYSNLEKSLASIPNVASTFASIGSSFMIVYMLRSPQRIKARCASIPKIGIYQSFLLAAVIWLALQWNLVEFHINSNNSQILRRNGHQHSREVVVSQSTNRLSSPMPHSCQAGNQTKTFLQVPDFILAGAQKAGTTALSTLLEKHPSIVRSERFEEHFFDMRYGIELKRSQDNYPHDSIESIRCRMRELYAQRLNFPAHAAGYDSTNENNHILTFEKTPFYLMWPHIPHAIADTSPWAKIIIMLRNPVDRLYSHYKMYQVLHLGGGDERFRNITVEHMLRDQLSKLHNCNVSKAPFLEEFLQLEFANINDINHKTERDFLKRFEPPTLSQEEQDSVDSITFRGFGNHRENQRYLQRGMYDTQIERWLRYFTLNETLLVLQYEEFKANPELVYQQVLQFLFPGDTHPFVPKLTKEELATIYRPPSEATALRILQEKREGDILVPLQTSTRRYLQAFYRPYNIRLAKLLGDPKWKWDE